MSTADSPMPSLARKLVITMLALLALAYTRPARSIEQAMGDTPVACSSGDPAAAARERAGVRIPDHASVGRRMLRDASLHVSMRTSFDPASRLVRLVLQPRDSGNAFISNLRPGDFVVYDNGARRNDITVTVERPPVTLGILIEHGGRYQMLNEGISEATSLVAQQFLGAMRPEDRVAVWSYDDELHEIVSFSQRRDAMLDALHRIESPLPLSESNLYDALIGALAQMRNVSGPKALLVISSGVDTFSRATLAEALRAAERSGVPIFAIDIAKMLRHEVFEASDSGPYEELGWHRAKAALDRLAMASGGRMYVPESVLDLSGEYDDLMEDARARYVITYHPESTEPPAVARVVRVEIRPNGGAPPRRIASGNGRFAPALAALQGTYVPSSVVAENTRSIRERSARAPTDGGK